MKKEVLMFLILAAPLSAFAANLSGVASILLGDMSGNMFIACLILGYVSMFVRVLWNVLHRDPTTARTPLQFDKSFFWNDNFIRFILNFILVPLFIIGGPHLKGFIPGLDSLPEVSGLGFSIFAGLLSDWILMKALGDKIVGTATK